MCGSGEKVLTVAEVLKRDGAAEGESYVAGGHSWTVRNLCGQLFLRGESIQTPNLSPETTCIAHVPSLSRVKPKVKQHKYVMKVRLHGQPEEAWGTEKWAANMRGDADVEYVLQVPGTERLMDE